MTRLVVRLLIVPIGIGVAALAGIIVALSGAISAGYGENFAGFVVAVGASVLHAALTGVDPDAIGQFLGLIWLVAIGVFLAPLILIALIGELFGLTSWLVYVFGAGALFAAVPILFPGDPATHGWPANAALGFAATGFAAGFVYWLVAGRGAGHDAIPTERRPG